MYKVDYKPVYIKKNNQDSEIEYSLIDVNYEIEQYEKNKTNINENEYKQLIKKREELQKIINN